jgi:hypothetical protein
VWHTAGDQLIAYLELPNRINQTYSKEVEMGSIYMFRGFAL